MTACHCTDIKHAQQQQTTGVLLVLQARVVHAAPTCGYVKRYNVLTAHTLQVRLSPRQITKGTFNQLLLNFLTLIRLTHHQLNLLFVLVRNLGPAAPGVLGQDVIST